MALLLLLYRRTYKFYDLYLRTNYLPNPRGIRRQIHVKSKPSGRRLSQLQYIFIYRRETRTISRIWSYTVYSVRAPAPSALNRQTRVREEYVILITVGKKPHANTARGLKKYNSRYNYRVHPRKLQPGLNLWRALARTYCDNCVTLWFTYYVTVKTHSSAPADFPAGVFPVILAGRRRRT